MKKKILVFFLFPALVMAQKTSIIKGFIKNSENKSIENVSVNFGRTGTTTNDKGYYEIRIPINKKTRSLNVAMSVAIVASEALKQVNLK